MRGRISRAAVFLLCAVLSACATTGDPRQGGLFRWSDAKARERQAEKRQAANGAEANATAEASRTPSLQRQAAQSEHALAAAAVRHRAAAAARASANQRAVQEHAATTLERAAHLVDESPTPATASRARILHGQARTLAADSALTAAEKARRLHQLDEEIAAQAADSRR